MKEETYRKVVIKTEADLPKEDGWYSVHSIGANVNDSHNSCWLGYIYKQAWLRDYDWYLQPVTAKTDQEQPISGYYEGICPKCGKVFKCNMQGDEYGRHDCNPEQETNEQPERVSAEKVLKKHLYKYVKTVYVTKPVRLMGLSNLMNAPHSKYIFAAMEEFASQHSIEQETKHQLQYNMWSNKVSWCPICKDHFYNDRNEMHTTKATKEHYHIFKPIEQEKPSDVAKTETDTGKLIDMPELEKPSEAIAKEEITEQSADKEVSDADIERYYPLKEDIKHPWEVEAYNIGQEYRRDGAKAMRDGLIKKG